MKYVISCVSAAVLAAALVAPAVADNRTVKGEVVDLACSISKGDGGKGEAHAACAMACAKRGNQMAILTSDAVYLVEGDYAANSNAKLLDFVARQVEAKGDVVAKDGKMTINVASMALLK
jgi:type 1 fimbria pilin